MDSEGSGDDSSNGSTQQQPRTARKSTAGNQKPPVYSTRRQAAKNASRAIYATSAAQKASSAFERQMENFNPDLSNRERRKISRKFSAQPNSSRRPAGALYDDHGKHLASGVDLCDCLNERCPGCWFECPKCDSKKCGADCRTHRKFIVESIEYHGYDKVVRSPIGFFK